MKAARELLLGTLAFAALAAPGGARAADRWLFVGDSHSVRGFGDGLREQLIASGIAPEAGFYQYSVSGSAASHWTDQTLHDLKVNYAVKVPGAAKVVLPGAAPSRVRPLPALVRELRPGTVVFALGTNDSARYFTLLHHKNVIRAREDPLKSVLAPVRALVGSLGGARCYWVLPPYLATHQIPAPYHARYTAALAQELTRLGCQVVDSRSIRAPGHPPGRAPGHAPSGGFPARWKDCERAGSSEKPLRSDQPDGIHFLHASGEYWGKCAALRIANLLGR